MFFFDICLYVFFVLFLDLKHTSKILPFGLMWLLLRKNSPQLTDTIFL